MDSVDLYERAWSLWQGSIDMGMVPLPRTALFEESGTVKRALDRGERDRHFLFFENLVFAVQI
jgi:hypothetical protein